jgi:hypothetical protein
MKKDLHIPCSEKTDTTQELVTTHGTEVGNIPQLSTFDPEEKVQSELQPKKNVGGCAYISIKTGKRTKLAEC